MAQRDHEPHRMPVHDLIHFRKRPPVGFGNKLIVFLSILVIQLLNLLQQRLFRGRRANLPSRRQCSFDVRLVLLDPSQTFGLRIGQVKNRMIPQLATVNLQFLDLLQADNVLRRISARLDCK